MAPPRRTTTAVTTFRITQICSLPPLPNRMAADITYVETDQGWLYLLTGHGSVQPQDRGLGDGRSLPLAASKMATVSATACPALIHRFRSGLQSASAEYRKAMQSGGFKASMSRKCDCSRLSILSATSVRRASSERELRDPIERFQTTEDIPL